MIKYLAKYYFIRTLTRFINPSAIKNCNKDKTARILSGCQIVNTTIGKYSYIGDFTCVINCAIGNFTSIAQNCIIGDASHPITWVSTSPVFYSGTNIMGKNFANNIFDPYLKTEIGNDVWIGSNCLIKAGVRIGNGAIVGMGSIVTHDIPDYEIWAGNPAKLIKKRFKENDINKLLKIKWWNWSDETVKNEAKYFNDIESFLNKYRD
jgi:Acetyltransferase (isoleucine patch superfamily)